MKNKKNILKACVVTAICVVLLLTAFGTAVTQTANPLEGIEENNKYETLMIPPPQPLLDNDVGVVSINSPDEEIPEGYYNVGATVENFGTLDQDTVPVHCEITENDVYTMFLDENFTGLLFPPEGWSQEEPDEWYRSWDDGAGGEPGEALLACPYINGDYAYLDSGPVNTIGMSELTLEFKHKIYDGYGGYYCRVLTRADAYDTWTDVTPWSNPVTGDVGPETLSFDISSDIGNGTQVRFEFEGDSWNILAWSVDDVKMYYREAGNVVYTSDITVNVAAGSTVDVEFTPSWYAEHGEYMITVQTELADDEWPSNDKRSMIVNVNEQILYETEKLIDLAGYFGVSVDLDGNSCVVGAYYAQGGCGGASVFHSYDGSTWFKEDELLASDCGYGDLFGYSVAIDGDFAVVGAPGQDGDDPDEVYVGAAYVFRRDGSNWYQYVKLEGTGIGYRSAFGDSVDIDGDVIAVVAPYWPVKGEPNTSSGVGVYVFRYDGSNWVEEQKLNPSSPSWPGNSVAIDGDTIVFSASDSIICVFHYDGNSWVKEAEFSDGGYQHYFGCSVDVDSDTIVVGAKGYYDMIGLVYVFRYNGSNWVEEAVLTASDSMEENQFGCSVAIDGNTIVVGADELILNEGIGSAYVFRHNGSDWSEEFKLLPSDGEPNDRFGCSVDVDSNIALIGAPGYSGGGAAYVFTFEGVWCIGDIDGDGDTDHSDLGELLSAWGSHPGDPNWNPDADLDDSGEVGHSDLGILLGDWGCGCDA